MMKKNEFISGFNQNISEKVNVDFMEFPYSNQSTFYVAFYFDIKAFGVNYHIKNDVVRFPYGMTHFIEHLLFLINKKSRLSFQEYGATINGITSENGILFEVQGSFFDNKKQNLVSVVKEFILFFKYKDYDEISIKNVQFDIINEHSYLDDKKRFEIDFSLTNSLKELIFQNSGFKYELIGKIKDINSITLKDVSNAHEIFLSSLSSITIGHKKINKTIALEISNLISENFNHTKIKQSEALLELQSENIRGQNYPKLQDISKVFVGIKYQQTNNNVYKNKAIELLLNYSFSTLKCFSFNNFIYFVQNSYLDSWFFLDYQNFDDLFNKMFYEFSQRIYRLRDYLNFFQIDYFTTLGERKSMIKHFYIENNINNLSIIDVLEEVESLNYKDVNDYFEEIQNNEKKFYLAYASPHYGLI